MIPNISYKTKHFFFVLAKLGIVIGAVGFIYHKLVNNDTLDFDRFYQFLTKNSLFSLKNIAFLLILSSFNWFFEIFKWRILVQSISKISLKQSAEQCLGALTASLLTPNRIGEYGAKAVYFKRSLRKKILLLNLLGNLAQMTVTTILGCIGLLFFMLNYDATIFHGQWLWPVIITVVAMVIGVYFLRKNNFKIKGFSVEKIKAFVAKMPRETHLKNLGLSLLRYAVFSFQFFVLLRMFQVEIDYLVAMVFISSMYLLASVIPSIFLFDVVVKGGVAVFLFGFAGVNELTVLCVITLMWLLNVVLPSCVGSYFVLNFNLPKT